MDSYAAGGAHGFEFEGCGGQRGFDRGDFTQPALFLAS